MSASSPLARLLRRRPALAVAGYLGLVAELIAVALIAAIWFVKRATGLTFLPWLGS